MHPTWSTKQVMTFLTRMWKRMNAEQKKYYKDLSDSDRGRFDHQRQSWKQSAKLKTGEIITEQGGVEIFPVKVPVFAENNFQASFLREEDAPADEVKAEANDD